MIQFNLQNSTNILFGDKINELPKLLQKGNYKNIMFLYGGGSIKTNGVYNDVTEQLKQANVNVIEFSGVEPNPRYTTMLKAAQICKKNNVDLILAVGGGSVIDCAKGIAMATHYTGNNFWHEVKAGTVSNIQKAVAIGTVLTLSATGSEMNTGSVISNMETNEKLAFNVPQALPVFSILNPKYTYSVPKNQIAAGVVDAFSHCLEQFFSSNNNFATSDNILIAIMKTLKSVGRTAMDNPTDYNSHANIMWSATMALNGITGAGKNADWSTHLIEHAVSAYYDITHAVGLAVITPNWMQHVLTEENANRFVPLADIFNININNKSSMEIAKLVIKHTSDFFLSLDMPKYFKDININTDHLDDMVTSTLSAVTQQGGNSIGKFKVLTASDIKTILINSIG